MEGKGEEQSPAGGPLKKGPWTSAEDAILIAYVQKHGEGNWNSVQKHSGLCRCGKSCRLRWANHLRPNLKKGAFTAEEERLIIELHAKLGNKWAKMATQLPGRTDNEIKNYWNTRIKRRQRAGLPVYPPDVQKTASPNSIFDQTGSKSLNSAVKSQLKNLSSEFSGLNAIALQRSGSSSICRPGAFSFSPILSSSRIEELKRSSRNSFTTTPIYKAVPIPQFSDESSICLEPYLKIRRTYGPGSSSRMASFSSGFALEPDPGPYQNFLQTGHSILNSGPFSCAKPDAGLKLELPSSQSTDSVESGNNPPAQFSVSTCPISESDSAGSISSSSGLLEAFLQGRKPAPLDQTNTDLPDPLLLLHNNNQLRIPVASELGSACKTAKWNEETSPASSSLISALGDQNFLRSGSFWQTTLHQLPRNGKGERGPEFGSGPYSEEEISNLLEYVRPGLVSSSATDWYNNSQNAAYNGENNNCPPFENAGFGTTDPEFGLVENPDSGNRHSWPDHQLGIGIGISSCPWNNMPGASQPSDFLPDCKQMVPPISSQIHDPCALLC